MNSQPEYYRYWGKATAATPEGETACHLLPWHCLDVAAVAARWWDSSPSLRSQFSTALSPVSHLRAWVLFFVALHDFGKFDIRFQAKAPAALRILNPDGEKISGRLPPWDHGKGGVLCLREDFRANAVSDDSLLAFLDEPPHSKRAWFPWMEAVAGHHGYVVREYHLPDEMMNYPPGLQGWADADRQARMAWLQALEGLFLQPVGLSLQDNPPPVSPLLAGFCSISDWLGSWSSEETFCYRSSVEPPDNYFARRYASDAAIVLERSGLVAQIKPWSGVAALLEKGHAPRQLQTLVDRLPEQPGLTLIEAPTGSGKTEAALAFAWRLLASGQADSIIFALPTQATANAMYARLERLAVQLFDRPNFILAHGYARFNPAFDAVKQRAANVQQAEEGWAQCCEWLSRGNKRAFLGQIGVCTVDQVLISVLPVKHRFIRGFGLGRSVLLVDEVHAYDSYMYGLLEAVLRAQSAAGQSALLLSATLPAHLKQRLLNTYPGDPAAELSSAYPLVTWRGQRQQLHFDLSATPEHLPAESALLLQPRYLAGGEPDDLLLQQMMAAAAAGAQVCLICNLVDVAQKTWQRLSAYGQAEVMLFHARFTLTDRIAKEQQVLECFGPHGNRQQGRILVATQVVEQSLDVDFDWLITQLCPVDLLFQRSGRLHRHQRNRRPAGFSQPMLTVLLPDAEGYGRSGYIYGNTRVMWRTQQLIEAQGATPLPFPAAWRQWIESAYRPEADDAEPGWVQEGYQDWEQKEFEKRASARQMLKQAEYATPFSDNDHAVRALTRDGEMSLAVIPYFDSEHGRVLLDGQQLDRLAEFARPEALALNRVNVPHGWLGAFLQPMDEQGVIWLPGHFVAGKAGFAGKGQHHFTYSHHEGMEKTG
ncbi:CRISPR-associated helicase/endonuclease Cas3 [Erwinia amylovora]|uniref:CRISPR-associated helicase/endonuclease Cas3 n=1 Tax=Erwinia amylovora TaxID=552 RepID=UPI000C070A43|nr:CRISPR-associated helicase/endonuclease Cas3 [Erwinia amylovora]